MVIDHEIVNRLLERMEQYLRLIGRMKFSKDELVSNIDIQHLLERRLQLAIETCIDVAQHLVSEERLSPRDTAADLFEALARAEIISEALSRSLQSAVGFRNLLVHEYGALNYELIYANFREDLNDLREFAAAVSQYLDT